MVDILSLLREDGPDQTQICVSDFYKTSSIMQQKSLQCLGHTFPNITCGLLLIMTSGTQEGQLCMHATYIYFIRRFMNLYEWKIRGALCANTRIHHHHYEWGRKMFKELCLLRVYYSGSQTLCGRWNHIKRARLGLSVCVCWSWRWLCYL